MLVAVGWVGVGGGLTGSEISPLKMPAVAMLRASFLMYVRGGLFFSREVFFSLKALQQPPNVWANYFAVRLCCLFGFGS